MTQRATTDWHRLWFAFQARAWRSLAVVPADIGIPTMPVGQMVMAISMKQHGGEVSLADLRSVELHNANAYLEVLRRHVTRGERVVLVLGSCFDHPATIPFTRAADCALLCVTMGATRQANAAQTVERIGKERFLGSVLVNAPEEEPVVLPMRPLLRGGP